MMADSVEPEAYGRAFGLHRAMDTVGAVVGPALALLLVGRGVAFHTVFWLTGIPGLLAVMAIALVREPVRAPGRKQGLWRTITGLPSSFQNFVLASGVFGLGNFAHTLLILRAVEVLSPALGRSRAGMMAIAFFTFHNVIYAACAFPAGWLGDRVPKRWLLAGAYGLFGVLAVGLMRSSASPGYLLLLFGVAGVYVAFVDSLEGSYAAELLPSDARGAGFGVLGTVNGIGDLVSSTLVGFLWSQMSASVGFGYAAALAFSGAVTLLLIGRPR
jgi:MFS family permease